MELITALQNLLDNFAIIKEVKYIKLQPIEKACRFFSIDRKAGFIFAGRFHEEIEGLSEIVGLTNLPLLRSILNSPGFKTPSAKATFVKATERSAAHIHFQNNSGHDHKYQCASDSAIDQLMPTQGMRLPSFELAFTPDNAGIELFKYWQKKIEEHKGNKHVGIFTKNKKVICQYHNGKSDITSFPLTTTMRRGNMTHVWRYEAAHISSVLNLYPVSKLFVMRITDRGSLWTHVDGGVAHYNMAFAPLWEDRLEIESPYNVPSDLPAAIENGFGHGMDVKAFIEKEIEGSDQSA